MKIENCTPHKISVDLANGTTDIFPPTGIIPRVESIETPGDSIGVIPVIIRELGKVTGLPLQKEGTILIVSSMVLSASDRTDLVAPDTGVTAIRKDGKIEAVTRLVRRA